MSRSRSRTKRPEPAGGGMSTSVRFGLMMSVALAVVMGIAGFLLANSTRDVARHGFDARIRSIAEVMGEADVKLDPTLRKPMEHAVKAAIQTAMEKVSTDGTREEFVTAVGEAALSTIEKVVHKEINKFEISTTTWKQEGGLGTRVGPGSVERFDIVFTKGPAKGKHGYIYRSGGKGELLVPSRTDVAGDNIDGLIIAMVLLVIMIGAAVAYGVGTQVARPIEMLADDVRQIAGGNLKHRTRVKGGGEVAMLARSIDRMSDSLADAQESEVENSIRAREMEVAQEVREALLPKKAPVATGYEVFDMHVPCAEPEGDFHDYIVAADGRVGMLICHVNGQGVPGALVGATARAYLRNELERGGDLERALKKVNRDLARDVRRGMYVTAIYVALDPKEHIAEVICAGHKIPLIRYESATRQIKTIQPDGIALAFDRGPIFDKKLELMRIPLEPGDRLVLANEGPARVVNADGEEFGETNLYRSVLRGAGHPAEEMLTRIQLDLEEFAETDEFEDDLTLICLSRLS